MIKGPFLSKEGKCKSVYVHGLELVIKELSVSHFEHDMVKPEVA